VPVAAATSSDNLQRLEGIGPKISTVLVAAGIRTYGDLAACDEATLNDTLRKGGVRFAPSVSTWTTQAELLAQGDEAGFTALTKELVAGRRSR
jgi:predicted flap endonuclease-1-like 5' DNA nuclease